MANAARRHVANESAHIQKKYPKLRSEEKLGHEAERYRSVGRCNRGEFNLVWIGFGEKTDVSCVDRTLSSW